MSRDKQAGIEEIEEIVQDVDKAIRANFAWDVLAGGYIVSSADNIAQELYYKDYRKASELAEEIFAEIEKKVKASLIIHLEEINKEHIKDTPLYERHSGIIFDLRQIEDFLAELKKKYIGKDTNVTTKESEKDNGN